MMNRAERRGNKRQKRGGKKQASGRPGVAPTPLMLAQHLHNQGRFAEAEQAYRRILKSEPMNGEALHLLGVLYHQSGRNVQAEELLRKAAAFLPDDPGVHNNLGNTCLALGKAEDARVCFEKAIAIDSNIAVFHYNFGNALKARRKEDEAIAAYGRALKINPKHAKAHNNLALILRNQNRIEDAIGEFRKALKIDDTMVEAHYNLVELLEWMGRKEDLRTALANAKKACPQHAPIYLIEAQTLKAAGRFEEARAVLERANLDADSDLAFQAERHQILGQVCDRLGDVDAAFSAFSKSNAANANNPAHRRFRACNYRDLVNELLVHFAPDNYNPWTDFEPDQRGYSLVFMVGFPRSGTTLLDTILRSHSAIEVVEEMPMVANMVLALRKMDCGYPCALDRLTDDEIAHLRSIYFEELARHVTHAAATRCVVDKLPLNLIDAGLIRRVFPDAKFIFAYRHPCDCVLSCFMQNFGLNDAMANFLDLGDAAELYDRSMTLWERYKEVLELQTHMVRYEDLVVALEDTVRPLLEFLELDWDANVTNYVATAKSRKVDTPSYDQVSQPLYTRARGRWEKYRTHMEPVLPKLLPWVRD